MNTSEAKYIMTRFGDGLTIKEAEKTFGDDFYALIVSAAYQTGTYLTETEDGIWRKKVDKDVFKSVSDASEKPVAWKQLETKCTCGKSFFVVQKGQGYVCNVCGEKRICSAS